MKKMLLCILPVLLLCGAPMYAMTVEAAGAEQTMVTIPLENLSGEMVKNVMNAKKKADEMAAAATAETANSVVAAVKSTSPEELSAWLKVIGDALKTFCTDIGVGANEFLKTPVGMLIAGLAAFNYGGLDIINMIFSLVLSTMVWLIATGLCVWSYRRSHFKRVSRSIWPWNTTDPVVIEPALSEDDKTGSMSMHCAVWLLISAVCTLTAFNGW